MINAYRIRSVGSNEQGNAIHFWISGNPSKFLQGHNLFCTAFITRTSCNTI
ncbi:hypothetical protein ISG33_05300 [Glaciecola sp. MH2013]|uniref:phage/plasmid replication domain-containing protein n=1 Tax=Glaciecola sp. MH2013 TaxID=2785524 RepID=UPI0018A0533C|nr:hypothetical protein [Glaciecola sp. MH2013]